MKVTSSPRGAPCWVDLSVRDLDATLAFYSDLLGWQVRPEPNSPDNYLLFLTDGEPVAGAGLGPDDPAWVDTWNIHFHSTDLDRDMAAAEKAGAALELAPIVVPGSGMFAVYRDPAGAAFGLWQPTHFPGFHAMAEPGAPTWFELATSDLAAAAPFYETLFGWELEQAPPGHHYRQAKLGGQPVAGVVDFPAASQPTAQPAPARSGHHASRRPFEGPVSTWTWYVGVEDAEATCARVVELGGSVITPPDVTAAGAVAWVADPGGATFKVHQPAAWPQR